MLSIVVILISIASVEVLHIERICKRFRGTFKVIK